MSFCSSGKLFWDLDDKSKVSYSLDVSSNNRRRDMSYNGDFKLGLPCRTFGVSGSVRYTDVFTIVSHVVCLLLMGKLLRPHSTVPCSVMFMALVELSPLAFVNVACALFHVV